MGDWKKLPERLEAAIEEALVAGLNWAIEMMEYWPEPVDEDRMFQEILCGKV